MFVIQPDPYLRPCYRISPFQTGNIAGNLNLPLDSAIDAYFTKRFGKNTFSYVENGRKAINKALSHYNLKKNDLVTIITTTNNFYISNCVTSEIEKFCNWNREITDKTKVILVNHEFGFPYEQLEALKKYNLPIIEDCAHSFFSKDKNNTMGTIGDFVIYSFPKIFPIQIGGLLVSNIEAEFKSDLNKGTLQYIKNVLSHYISGTDNIIKKRIEVYNALKKELAAFGFTERFELKNGIVPGVFMFKVPNKKIDLNVLKTYFQSHGIQCSVFYGESAFFLPCHQHLEENDIMYFKAIMESYLKELK